MFHETGVTCIMDARNMVSDYLTRYSRVIRAMRSYHQHISMHGVSDATAELGAYIENNSNNVLGCVTSGLFAIDSTRPELIHESNTPFDNGSTPNYGDIRGFWFLVKDRRTVFECAAVDNGKSLETLQNLGYGTKEQLLRRFSEGRERNGVKFSGKRDGLPAYYSALLTELDNKSYNIETLVSVRFFDERLSYKR
ncbi:MAG: hypothetical protein V1836_03100 [Candidatus Aenigmatarchaeota archaeon]